MFISISWSWGIDGVEGVSSTIKESPGGCLSFFEYYIWGNILFEETVLGDAVNAVPPGLLIRYFL